MTLKSEIKKAITLNSSRFNAKKVWDIRIEENMLGEIYMTIEVEVTKKPKYKPKK